MDPLGLAELQLGYAAEGSRPSPGPRATEDDEAKASVGADVDRSKHRSGIVPQLQNVVSTCFLGRQLDLKHIAMHARNAEYNPRRFAAVIMRIREPKTTALIFSSGGSILMPLGFGYLGSRHMFFGSGTIEFLGGSEH